MVVFGTPLSFRTHAFSHLYPEQLHMVVRFISATSRQARFTLQVLWVYTHSWISVSENNPSRQLVNKLGKYRYPSLEK
jgi:hypothetical protein